MLCATGRLWTSPTSQIQTMNHLLWDIAGLTAEREETW